MSAMSNFLVLLLTSSCIRNIADGKTVYPLYGIDSGKDSNNLTQNDINVIADNFQFLQCSYDQQQLTALHKASKKIAPVWYVNSDSVASNDIETTDRYGASVYLYGNLKESITASTTKFTVKSLSKNVYLKASTVSGNYTQNTSNYVTFIRIGKELMKITNVTTMNSKMQQTVTVVRGFNNSTPVSYKNNSNVYHPVYDGGGFPDGSRGGINYIVDPTQMYGKNRLIQHTSQAVQDGYNGSWFDCFSASQYDAVDQCGNKLKATWSFEYNQPWNRTTFGIANHDRLIYVLNETRKVLGYYPVITANSVAGSYFPQDGNCREFLQQDQNVPYKTILNGYSLERFAGGEQNNNTYHDGCPVEGFGLELVWNNYKTWLNNVKILMDASQRNLGIMPMAAQAGCKSIRLETVPADERDNFEMFAYTSFLLGVEKMDGNSRLGIPPFYQNENYTLRYAYVHPRYYWNIGNPVQSYNYENVTNYRLNGKNTFLRYFENGLIMVNPTNITDSSIGLNKSYYNPDTQKWIKTIDSVGQRGYILLNNETQYL